MTVSVRTIVLDSLRPRSLAGFYAEVTGWKLREDEDVDERAVLVNPDGGVNLAFQYAADFKPTTWPAQDRPQMLHLDLGVDDLDAEQERVLGLGARLLDTQRTFRVYADPEGHTFCLCAC
ncbi:VOC family protein [Kutzneria viridogrisea]|uniref:Enzyme related to lactoylglutathione lyase n=1 Tax=Kutzneria viridogrisea TaxID=47990 RepID=A0ABR6BXU4_9PSEU|nr:putative enzyme related to lactoylglutathione lyase [Kutzneria viridogrisea]